MTKTKILYSSADDNSIDGSRLTAGSVSSDKLSLPLSGENIEYTGAATGQVPRTVDAKFEEDWVSIRDFGAISLQEDPEFDSTEAIQACLNEVVLNRRGAMYIPPGTYRFSQNIVAPPPGAGEFGKRYLRIIGAGANISGLSTLGENSLRIWAAEPPAFVNAWLFCELRDFSLSHGVTISNCPGLDIYCMQLSKIENLEIAGWDVGILVRSSWTNKITRGRASSCNVGIKAPIPAADQIGFNTTLIEGFTCTSCVKAGMSIHGGSSVSIKDCLLESNPVTIYSSGCLDLVIDNNYFEGGGYPPTRPWRDGQLNRYLLWTGEDEDGNFNPTNRSIQNLTYRMPMTYFGAGAIYLDYVSNVNFPDIEPQRAYIWTGKNIKGWHAQSIACDTRLSTPLVEGRGRSSASRNLRTFPQNLIPNGDFLSQNLPVYTTTSNGSQPTLSFATTALEWEGVSRQARVLDITCPAGATSMSVTFNAVVPPNSQFWGAGFSLGAIAHVKTSDGTFSQIATTIQSDAPSAGGSATNPNVITSNLTDWNVVGGEQGYNPSGSYIAVQLSFTRSSAGSAAHLYVEEIRLAVSGQAADFLTFAPMDLEVGLSGSATCSTADGGWFRVDLDSGYAAPENYNVVLTPEYDGTKTSTQLQVEKIAGGGTFRVWSDKNSTFSYRVLPKVMRLP
jgi:hypothetical protein